jgi:hypothetical protein
VRCDDGVFAREPLARSGADRLLYQPLSHGDCRTHVFTSDGSALGRDLSRRIAAAASFDGGDLATVSELSPHLLAPKMKGRIYVAGADKGNSYLKEMAERLEKTLSDAGESRSSMRRAYGIDPRLVATVRHFGRTGRRISSRLRAGGRC